MKVSISESDWNKLRFEHRDPVEFFGSWLPRANSRCVQLLPVQCDHRWGRHWAGGRAHKGAGGLHQSGQTFAETEAARVPGRIFYQERKRFTFNNQTTDAARVSTCMAFYIFRKMGVPASRCNFAHIHVNENDMGIYANVEPIKKPMLQRLFGDDSGNLYEGTASDIRNEFDARVEKKTNEDEDDWSDVERLKAALDSTDDDAIDQIAELVDIDAFWHLRRQP